MEILVPVPEDADSPRFRTNVGTVHYAPEKSAIIWKIKQFGGGKEFLMRAELGLPSVKGDDEHGGGMTGGFGGSMGGAGQGGKGKRPINVKFEIPYFTTSGIQVRYLKITEPKVRLPLFTSTFYSTLSTSLPICPYPLLCYYMPSTFWLCSTFRAKRRLSSSLATFDMLYISSSPAPRVFPLSHLLQAMNCGFS